MFWPGSIEVLSAWPTSISSAVVWSGETSSVVTWFVWTSSVVVWFAYLRSTLLVTSWHLSQPRTILLVVAWSRITSSEVGCFVNKT